MGIMSRESDLAWAAGIFEGEGCITRQNNPRRRPSRPDNGTKRGRYPRPEPKPTLNISVSMTDRDVLDRFTAIVGIGSTGEHTPDARFKIQWRWTAYSDNARAVIKMLWPWLGERRRARAIELWNATVNRNEVPLP